MKSALGRQFFIPSLVDSLRLDLEPFARPFEFWAFFERSRFQKGGFRRER
jgi:hypothetical protein